MPGVMRIGKLQIDAPFYQAGLAGYSDAAMRLVARRHGAPYAVTEAMVDTILLNGGQGFKAAELDDADHPIAGQIMGAAPDEMAAASKILVRLGYDVVDVNLACPVKKIRKRFRGGHLLQMPDTAIAMLDAVRQATPAEVPCTVKLRRGTDDSPDAERNFHRIFEAVLRLGYAGATVHGRTVEQKYIGPSRWAFLAGLVREYGLRHGGEKLEPAGNRQAHATEHRPSHTADHQSFCLMGSGDIWCAADIFRMIRETGVQGVSVARGCIGNPWVFTQARALLVGDEARANTPPTIFQQRDVLLEHFELSVRLHGEFVASRMMRKFGIKFARHHPQAEEVARGFVAVTCVADWQRVVADHYAADGPGAAATMEKSSPLTCGNEREESCEPATEA